MRQVPGVESAALVTSPPLSGLDMGTSFEILGQAKDPANKPEARVSGGQWRLRPDHGHAGRARPHD